MATQYYRAKRLNCTNADWPDHYGHYREAKYAQIKHHWWWKANVVFDRLEATLAFDGNSGHWQTCGLSFILLVLDGLDKHFQASVHFFLLTSAIDKSLQH